MARLNVSIIANLANVQSAIFVRSVVIEASVQTVFGFHERADALALLSPPFAPVRLVSTSGGIQTGARVELRVGPFTWIALHTAYEKNRLFVDQQIDGPFALWVHRHEFDDLGERSRLTDRVEYRLPGGAVLNLLLRPFVTLALGRMFRYRHRITRLHCEQS